MKILVTTTVFHPTIGGVETIVRTLAREFVRVGHDVTVATTQDYSGADDFPFEVCRRPGLLQLMRCHAQSGLLFQFGGVRLGWPSLFRRSRSAIVHQIWPRAEEAENPVARRLRRTWLSHSCHICPSESLGKSLGVPFRVIPNPYDAAVFQLMPAVLRDRDLIFVGRLIPEKGADVFMAAVARLKSSGRTLSVTVVGDGPMRVSCEQQAKQLGLHASVAFVGAKQGEDLAAALNAHKIMVVPSRWKEPFGIVALEGIACGCAVIGSSGGGLPEAIGPCGVTFPNGDAVALAETIETLLLQPDQIKRCQTNAGPHLARHTPETVARQYLQLLQPN